MAEKMEGAPGTGRRPGPTSWWLIAKEGGGRLEVLTVGLGGGRTLPVFGSREEAGLFLRASGSGRRGGWRARETGSGELVSVLCGPCRGVGRVALDPPPGIFEDGTARLVGVGRERFVGRLLGRG